MKKDKKPWEVLPKVWSTEAKFMSYLRGVIRKGWSRYPIKAEFMKARRIRATNPATGKQCFGFNCAMCKKFTPQSNVEIDHLVGNNQFKSVEDATSYLKALLFIDFDDLQPLCKPCHRVKSYAERMGITFEEAEKTKMVIEMMKDKKKVDKLLAKHNLPCNNDKVRRASLEKLIEEDKL